MPLSIATSPAGPYDDEFSADGFLHYRYRGTDPGHRDNVGLRLTCQHQRPLAYLHGIVPGQYLAVWPVYVVRDDPAQCAFHVAVDDAQSVRRSELTGVVSEDVEIRRAYVTASVKHRIHQQAFRERVLQAYQMRCTFCQLGHRELLDAAHIIPDYEPAGRSTIKNGLALCKLHHAAFDRFLIGVTPDYRIQIRDDLMDEEDGPLLQPGFKDLHHSRLILPHSREYWPGRENLSGGMNNFGRPCKGPSNSHWSRLPRSAWALDFAVPLPARKRGRV